MSKPVFSQWYATTELRYYHYPPAGGVPRLQQRWRRYSYGVNQGVEFEWRDVPTVIGEPAK